MFVLLNVRTMHSSALRALECIVWGRAVQQVTRRQVTPKQVTPKLVTPKLGKERERETGDEVHF